MAKNIPTFNIMHLNNEDGTCPQYALFASMGYNTVLVGNRALRRHPKNFNKAWEGIKEVIFNKYGYQPYDGIRWVTQAYLSNTIQTFFYEDDKCIGLVEVNRENGMILGSEDYTTHNCLPRHMEAFAASIS